MTARRTDPRSPAGLVEPAPPPDRQAPAGRRPTLAERAWEHRTSLVVLLVLLALVAVVHATGMSHAPQRNDDEGTYVAQAWAVQHWRTLGHYTYWYDHPPLGWLLIAAWTAATGAFGRAASAVAAGRELMLVLQLASAALLFVLARRLGLRRTAAAGGVLLFALSPLALGFHRAVYLDNVATPFLLGAFVLALSPRHRLAAHAGAGLCFAAAVLAKETSLLLAPALLWQYWQVSDRRTRRYGLTVAASLFVLVCSTYLLYATLRGELLPGPGHVSLVDAVRFQLAGRAPSGSPFDPGSPGRGTIGLWLGLDPWLLAAAVVLVPAGLAIRRLRPVTAGFAILGAMTLRPGYLPVPLVIGMLPFASLLVAGVADTAWGRPAGQGLGKHEAPGGPGGLPAGRALVAVCLLVAAVVVVPRWWQGDRELMTADQDAPFRQAEAWIAGNAPREARLLVDDALWVDLVERGRPPGQVVWFYKLDTDRDVRGRYPRGWRDFDYVVSTATLRGFPERLPQVAEALRHSDVAASFGRGNGRVEIRKVRGSPVSSPR
ncbi:MAG TPA: glycosyltransferase family 39 protein [Actinomycetota bacterium]|nr:glycosyltransferase family 39 protein [Actinomycetota bacterium]